MYDMKHLLIKTFMLMVFMAAAPYIAALDLPKKNINGTEYYYYEVKRGDTLFSLSHRFGITRELLVKYNPSAADVVKAGDVLYFPVEAGDNDVFEPVEPGGEMILHKVKKGESLYGISKHYGISIDDIVALNPSCKNGLKAGATLKIPVRDGSPEDKNPEPVSETDGGENDGSVYDTIVPLRDTAELRPVNPGIVELETIVAEPRKKPSIVVMLPFMLGDENISRQSQLYTDFYKGLLIAADTLSNRGDSIRIIAYDTEGNAERISSLMANDDVKDASVIIAPDDVSQLQAIARQALDDETYIVNIFNIKDSLYLTNPVVLQANLPQARMYEKAVDALETLYEGYTPVFLTNTSGRNEKESFVNYARQRYLDKGVAPVDIAYEGALLASNLDELADSVRYVFIPSSGTLAEFNKFSHVLKNYIGGRDMAVFGYPDWTAFRGDALAMLHTLGATIYSRFYEDKDSLSSRNLNDAFMRWYGREMLEAVPVYGILGFDLGNFLIRNIRNNDGTFVPDAAGYTGAQSSFAFVRPDSGSDSSGFVNDEIYIIRYDGDGRTERIL